MSVHLLPSGALVDRDCDHCGEQLIARDDDWCCPRAGDDESPHSILVGENRE